MEKDSAKILITKLGAAERQLNAAIRMVLTNEDELAIHTVLAAAYQILRNIKFKRGRSDAHDLFLRGIFAFAEDLANGKRPSIPKSIAESAPTLIPLIESIRDGILTKEIKSFDDIPPISVGEKGPSWAEFNRPASFLKHADKDPSGTLDLSKIKNDELLMRASAAFFELTNRISPEMTAYYIFALSHHEASGLPEDIRLEFGGLPSEQKREKCLAWLREQRATEMRNTA